MNLRSILASVFLVPAEGAAPVVDTGSVQTVAVLAAPDQLAVAARVVATGIASPRRGRALVCVWGEPAPLPSRRGRAPWVVLPRDPGLVRGAIADACHASPPGPLVVAIGGPRPPELEELVAGADAVIVAWRAEHECPVAELAFARACRAGQAGGVLRLPDGLAGAALQRGVRSGPAVRAAEGLLRRTPPASGEPRKQEVRHALADAPR